MSKSLDKTSENEQDDPTCESHEEALSKMANEKFNSELDALLKLRASFVYITTNEEARLHDYFKHFSMAKGRNTFTWDCHYGFRELLTGERDITLAPDACDVDVALEAIIAKAEQDVTAHRRVESGNQGNVFILYDFHRYLFEMEKITERLIRRFAATECASTIVLVAPHFESTPAVENLFHVLDFPYPNNEEIKMCVFEVIRAAENKGLRNVKDEFEQKEDEFLQAASGLTLKEVQDAFAKSVVINRGLDIKTITEAKRQIIARKEILEYCDPKVTMDDVGGLENLVKWFGRRKLAFSSKAKDYGL